jgi:hypothetical protein
VCTQEPADIIYIEWIREVGIEHASLKVRSTVSCGTYEAARCVIGTQARNIPSTVSSTKNFLNLNSK